MCSIHTPGTKLTLDKQPTLLYSECITCQETQMNYVVTEPGLTYFAAGQKLSAAEYAAGQELFGADTFIAMPYSQKLQREVRAARKTSINTTAQ